MSRLSVRDQDSEDFERRERRVQVVGRVIVGLLLVGAAFGLFGTGPLSSVRTTDGGLSVSHERFVRHTGKAQLTVTVAPGSLDGDAAAVHLSGDLIDSMHISSITPRPRAATTTEDGITYRFSGEPDTTPVITIHYRPTTIGTISGTITAGGTGEAEIWQLTYP